MDSFRYIDGAICIFANGVDLKRLDDAALHERKFAARDCRDTCSSCDFAVEEAERFRGLSRVIVQFVQE